MPKRKPEANATPDRVLKPDLVIITGMSGSGKLTALNAFEDAGFYAVDNLPISLVPKFADLTYDSKSRNRAALVVDIREGQDLKQFPKIYQDLKKRVSSTLLFLDAEDEVLQRRFSETRRPHPLGSESTVLTSIRDERDQLTPIRALADLCIDTSKLNVHELRRLITGQFQDDQDAKKIVVYVNSFGFRHGVPPD